MSKSADIPKIKKRKLSTGNPHSKEEEKLHVKKKPALESNRLGSSESTSLPLRSSSEEETHPLPLPPAIETFLTLNQIPSSIKKGLQGNGWVDKDVHSMAFKLRMLGLHARVVDGDDVSLFHLCSFIAYGLFEKKTGFLLSIFNKLTQEYEFTCISSWIDVYIVLPQLQQLIDNTVLIEHKTAQLDGLLLLVKGTDEMVDFCGEKKSKINDGDDYPKRYNIHDPVMSEVSAYFASLYNQTNDSSDAAWLKALKSWQWWAWWGSIFPTELVYSVAKSICGDNMPLILQLLFKRHNWEQFKPTLLDDAMYPFYHTIPCPLHIVMGKVQQADNVTHKKSASHIPLYGYTYFDTAEHLVIDTVSFNTSYTRLSMPIFILQQGLSHGHVRIFKTSNNEDESEQFEKEMVKSLNQSKHDCSVFTFNVPVPLVLMTLLYHTNIELLQSYGNIMQSHISKLLGFKHTEDRMTALSAQSNTWYQNLTGHQSILQSFLGFSIKNAAHVIDNSFNLGIKFAGGYVDQYDWFVSLMRIIQLLLQKDQMALLKPFFLIKKLPPKDKSKGDNYDLMDIETNESVASLISQVIEQSKETFLNPVFLGLIFFKSMERQLVGNSFMRENDPNYNWKLVLREDKLLLHFSDSVWWSSHKPSLAESSVKYSSPFAFHLIRSISPIYTKKVAANTTQYISSFNGLSWRPTTETSYRVKNMETVENVLITSEDFKSSYPFSTLDHLNFKNPSIDYTSCEKVVGAIDLTWLKSLVLSFLNGTTESVFRRNNQSLTLARAMDENHISFPRLVVKVLVDMLGYSQDDFLEFSLLLGQPETMNPSVIQHLLQYIYTCYISDRDENIFMCRWAPYIPASSLVFDTLTYLQLGKQSSGDDSKCNLLIVTAGGQYLVVCLNRLYGITYDIEVLYFSPLLKDFFVGQHITHYEFTVHLQQATFAMQFNKMTW